jgi:lysozyme
MFALGAKGTALIESFEKCRLTAYQDQGGVWTIGWGHTGPEVVEGSTCTQFQADAWFAHDTEKAVAAVNAGLGAVGRASINQNQFDALVAFTFNVGVGAESHSTLLRLVNLGDMSDAANEFLKWNHVGGVVSNGLTARRTAERALFLTAA